MKDIIPRDVPHVASATRPMLAQVCEDLDSAYRDAREAYLSDEPGLLLHDAISAMEDALSLARATAELLRLRRTNDEGTKATEPPTIWMVGARAR